MSLSFFSTHTGAGGADLGAIAAGLKPIGGIEIDSYPVELYRANFGDHIRNESILDTPIEQLPDFDFLWTSPTCVNFSAAKTDAKELEIDIQIAIKIGQIIAIKKPRYFALENVRGYVTSKSFQHIYGRLLGQGYKLHFDVYDAADFGVSQNRHRLILRASCESLGALLPTHSKSGGLWWRTWNGWFNAVSDLLPSCQSTFLTERQLQALYNYRLDVATLVDGKGNRYGSSYTVADGEAPSFTVTANMDRNISRAIILERTGYGDRDPTIRKADEPSHTIRASGGCDERGGFRSPITASLENADVRALDYRCLARLQSFPDSYKWGPSAGKNCRAIGNAVPSLFAQKVIESIVKNV